MTPKLLLKSVLQRFGYQIRKVPRVSNPEASFLHLDALADQKFLVQGKANVIFDIGAHVGQTAREYRSQFKDSTIYSFEPFPSSYSQLNLAAQSDDKIKPFNVALSNCTGKQTLYYTDFAATNSLLRMQSAGTEFLAELTPEAQQSCEVDVVTIDDFCSAHDVRAIDICKIDVQGAELRVLQGAKRLLSEAQIGLLYLEVNFNPYYDQQASFAQIYDLLCTYGYILFGLYDLNYGKKNSYLTEGNAIFVGKQLVRELAN